MTCVRGQWEVCEFKKKMELCLPFWKRYHFCFLHNGEEEGGEIGVDASHHHGHCLHFIVLEVDPRAQSRGVVHFIDIAALC